MAKSGPKSKRGAQAARTHWTATRARELLAEQVASGQSVAAFARGRGLRQQRLLWWRKRLADWGEEATAAPLLVPAVTVERRGPSRASAAASRQRPAPQVTLRVGKIRVEICDVMAVPPGWLAALVQELGAAR